MDHYETKMSQLPTVPSNQLSIGTIELDIALFITYIGGEILVEDNM